MPPAAAVAPIAPLRPIRLGKLTLQTNLFLAPLAGYTDLACRLIIRGFGGVGLACTDLLAPQGLIHDNPGTRVLLATCEADNPLAYQLFGSPADPMCEAARYLVGRGARVIDINMGCPVDKITERAGGSSMLCDVEGTVRLVERIVAAVPEAPVTAKLRLGWDQGSIVAPELARRLEEVGVQLITVHGRTRDMGFGGTVSLDGIAAVVSAVKSIPVIGNGDVRTPQDAAEMMRRTGCRGVMIGRAALSAPWIFRDTWSYLSTGIIPREPTWQEKCQILRDHFALLTQFRNQRVAALSFRQRISWYGKHMKPCQSLKEAMQTIVTAEDFNRVVDAFMEWREAHEREREDSAA
jgi:tRNA-dihydrouridine synthase B